MNANDDVESTRMIVNEDKLTYNQQKHYFAELINYQHLFLQEIYLRSINTVQYWVWWNTRVQKKIATLIILANITATQVKSKVLEVPTARVTSTTVVTWQTA